MASIAGLLERYPDETTVHPGHMGITTLGRERAANPFLSDLASR
jgi:hydroxyacylglutathione hydrolase